MQIGYKKAGDAAADVAILAAPPTNQQTMRWLKPNLKSIYGILGQTAPQASPDMALRTEDVRKAMLEAAASDGLAELHPYVLRRIRFADGIEALWYARTDLMTALASEQGEEVARERITVLSDLFQGLLPASLGARPAPRQR